MNLIKKLLVWSAFSALLFTGLAGVIAGSVVSAGAAWLAALIILPAVHKKLIEKAAIFRNTLFRSGVLSVLFVVSILSLSATQSDKDKAHFLSNKAAVLKEIKASIDDKKPDAAISTVQRYLQHFPEDPDLGRLKIESDLLLEKVNKEKELAIKAEAEKNQMSGTASQSGAAASQPSSDGGGGLSKVVGKVGSLIYLANGKTFAIERPTMLHIDGQIYPKGSGSPDYIQIGYRCRFTGTEFEVAEVFCER